jgi:hypothetical protein
MIGLHIPISYRTNTITPPFNTHISKPEFTDENESSCHSPPSHKTRSTRSNLMSQWEVHNLPAHHSHSTLATQPHYDPIEASTHTHDKILLRNSALNTPLVGQDSNKAISIPHYKYTPLPLPLPPSPLSFYSLIRHQQPRHGPNIQCPQITIMLPCPQKHHRNPRRMDHTDQRADHIPDSIAL